MIRRIVAIFVLLLSASVCFATGWHDYTLDIGDGYAIWRNNVMDINVANADRQILIGPGENDPIGPVVAYATTRKFIFTRNLGKKTRNLFEGDRFQDVDPEKEFFFVEVKSSGDKLSEEQKAWIRGNATEMQLPFKIAKIHKKKTLTAYA